MARLLFASNLSAKGTNHLVVICAFVVGFAGLYSPAWAVRYPDPGAIDNGPQSTAIGEGSLASSLTSTAVGGDSEATGLNSTAIGQFSWAEFDNSTAVGQDSYASFENTTAIGQFSYATAENSTALGQDSSARGLNSVAIGQAAYAGWRDFDNDGKVDPIDGDSSVEPLVENTIAIGQGSRAFETAATAIGQSAFVEIGAAGGTAIGQNSRVLSGATGSIALGQNSVASAPNTVSFGSPSNERRLTNVAPGIDDTDAATMGQLRQMSSSMGNLEGRVSNLEGTLDDVGALTSAFSALVPNARAKGDTQVSLGVGNYSSSSALAAGVFHYLNNNILLNAGFSTAFDNNETASRAGITVGW